MLEDFGQVSVPAGGFDLPLRYQTFESGSKTLHVFYCLWSDRVAPHAKPIIEDGSRESRIKPSKPANATWVSKSWRLSCRDLIPGTKRSACSSSGSLSWSGENSQALAICSENNRPAGFAGLFSLSEASVGTFSLLRSHLPTDLNPAATNRSVFRLLPSNASALPSRLPDPVAPALHRAQGQTEQRKTSGEPGRGFRNGRGARAGLMGPPPPMISRAVVLHREVFSAPQPSPQAWIALGQRIPSRIACGIRQDHQAWPDEWHCRRGPTPDRRVGRS